MLELKHITYKLAESGKVILDDFSYTFKDDCITAITGKNGSGKSTLTKLIVGILKPTSGKILLNGVDITDLSIDQRANLGLNYAFQQPVLFKGITIKDLIDIATQKENSIANACDYLSRVGLCAKEYINRDFDKTLSGGEQKRVELALALAKTGNTIIFDEPEAGIDLWSFEKLVEVFDKNKCYIIVSHQEKLLQKADEIIVLNDSKIESFGAKQDVLNKLDKAQCAVAKGGKNAR